MAETKITKRTPKNMIYIHKSRHTFVYVFFEFEVLKKVVYKLVSSSAIRALWQAEQFQTFLQLF